MTTIPKRKYLVRCKTNEAFTIKVLIDCLNKCIDSSACFVFNKDKITLNGMDKAENILCYVCLESKNFVNYVCNVKQLNVGISITHLYKMIKAIKRKDSLIIYIAEDKPEELVLIIERDQNQIKTDFKILNIQPCSIEPPSEKGEYYDPILCSSKEFQNMAKSIDISKEIEVNVKHHQIEFLAKGLEETYSRQVIFGEKDEDNHYTYSQMFSRNYISKLTKLEGLDTDIRISCKEDLPLKLDLKIGKLGNICIYIKSIEQVNEENDDENN